MHRFITALIVGLALAAPTSTAHAESTSPDVHMVGVDTFCVGQRTVYDIRLRNDGDHRRGIRGRYHAAGVPVLRHWSMRIAADGVRHARFRLDPGEDVIAAFRSQRKVVGRVQMIDHCQDA